MSKLINHPDKNISFKGINLLIKQGVFTPKETITNSTSILIRIRAYPYRQILN